MLDLIFDCIARACRQIIDCTDNRFFEEFQAISSNYLHKIEADFKREIPSFFDGGHYRMPSAADLSSKSHFAQEFSSALEFATRNNDFEKALYYIKSVCPAFAKYIRQLTIITSDYTSFDYLNSNSQDTNIIVLPKVSANWQHSNMWKYFDYSINNYLTNIYIVDITGIKGNYKIKNYVLNYDLFAEEIEKGKIVISISPITCKDCINLENVEIKDINGKEFFSVNELQHAEEITDNIKSIFSEARKRGVNILVFPEMLGTQDQIPQIQKLNLEESNTPNINYPQITVMPTIWKDRDNYSNILIGQLNQPVAQKKTFRYPYQVEDGSIILEDLDLENKVTINIFHIEGIGRVIVAICKDLLMRKHLDFLIGDLKASIILVPSFSTGDYPFKMISYYGFPYDCNIVWINSCAAKHLLNKPNDSFETIGVTYNPSRSGTDNCVKEYKNSACDGQCDKCLFTFELNLKE